MSTGSWSPLRCGRGPGGCRRRGGPPWYEYGRAGDPPDKFARNRKTGGRDAFDRARRPPWVAWKDPIDVALDLVAELRVDIRVLQRRLAEIPETATPMRG